MHGGLLFYFYFLQVVPAIECLTKTGALFEDGRSEDFDAVILSTGYRSNVPRWLKVATYFLNLILEFCRNPFENPCNSADLGEVLHLVSSMIGVQAR